ncbi:MAG: sodium ion-translocating decarboxylase subunit beta [Thermodesulfobacteriota bacterium]
MAGDISFWQWGLWVLIAILALGLLYIAIVFRLHPLFLVPLVGGLLFVNVPLPDLTVSLAPFFRTLQGGLTSGLYPALIFLGWGAGANLTYLIAHPRLLVLGLLTPLAILLVLVLGWGMSMPLSQAGSAALVGGGDGLAAVFLVAQIAPEVTGPVALAAFTLTGLYFLLQPYLVELLVSKQERMLRMPPSRKVSRRESLLFASAGLVLTLILMPWAALLTGMFFLGNILKEAGVMDRLARTLSNRLADILVALLGLAVGSQCHASLIFTLTFLKIIILGLVALVLATAVVILAIKALNLFSANKINPLIGAAALGLLPDAAQMVQIMGRREDPHNHLFYHALATGQAALIASTLTAGLLWSILGGR